MDGLAAGWRRQPSKLSSASIEQRAGLPTCNMISPKLSTGPSRYCPAKPCACPVLLCLPSPTPALPRPAGATLPLPSPHLPCPAQPHPALPCWPCWFCPARHLTVGLWGCGTTASPCWNSGLVPAHSGICERKDRSLPSASRWGAPCAEAAGGLVCHEPCLNLYVLEAPSLLRLSSSEDCPFSTCV